MSVTLAVDKEERTGGQSEVMYFIKARLSIRLTAPYSKERRKAASERAKNRDVFGNASESKVTTS